MTIPLNFFDVDLKLCQRQELLESIDNASIENPVRVMTPNPEIMLAASHNARLKEALRQATHTIIDGIGLLVALRAWSLKVKPLRKNLALYHGADCVNDLFKRYQNGEKSFYFLGGAPGKSDLIVTSVLSRYPNLRIIDAENGGYIDPNEDHISEPLANRINYADPDILLVGFGAPKQEIWINNASNVLNVPVMLGIGGSLDFYANKPRAPKLFRVIHLEWLFRMFAEPGHWRRALRAVILFPLACGFWMLRNLAPASRNSARNPQ